MPYVSLAIGGAYQNRSLLAAAQRCVNLYTEAIPQAADEPIQHTAYPTPGLTLARPGPNQGTRCTYRATTGNLYVCQGQQVFYIDQSNIWHLLGTIMASTPQDATPRTTPVSMSDNGSVILMCDGSTNGWYIDLTLPLASQVLNQIDTTINTGWLGSDRVDFQDTYFLANSPGTNIFYVSQSNVNAALFNSEFSAISSTVVSGGTGYVVNDVLTLTGTGGAQTTVLTVDVSGAVLTANVTLSGGIAIQPSNPVSVTGGSGTGATFNLQYTTGTGAWNPLDFAGKTAGADPLVSAISVHDVVWLIGTETWEIWYDSGGGGSGALTNNTFPFEKSPALFGMRGCAALYSLAKTNNQLFWLSQDQSGQGIVLKGEGESATRISTHAIETQISTYPIISDAIGYCYQQQGHVFYVLNFPSAQNINGVADAGATWVYDATSGEWHERVYIDDNGTEYRHRANCAAEAYGNIYCGDWENSNLYIFDLNNYTDNGQPIIKKRSSQHMLDLDGNRRVMYHQLIANMQVGSASTTGPSQEILDCSFTATNGTLLQNYANYQDVGASFSYVSASSETYLEILNDQLTAVAGGDSLYLVNDTPTSTDYTLSLDISQSSYGDAPPSASSIYVIGRANSSNNGYQAGLTSDGATISVNLKVMPSGSPVSVALGTLASGFYTMNLVMVANSITVSVYRSQDGAWLASNGTWTGLPNQPAISIVDSTYAGPGALLIGGNWA